MKTAGLALFAVTSEPPGDQEGLERRLGGRVTFLSDETGKILDAFGLRDRDGAPWYDRLFLAAQKGDIAFPATVLVGKDGRIAWIYRAKRVDDRPTVEAILAAAEGS